MKTDPVFVIISSYVKGGEPMSTMVQKRYKTKELLSRFAPYLLKQKKLSLKLPPKSLSKPLSESHPAFVLHCLQNFPHRIRQLKSS